MKHIVIGHGRKHSLKSQLAGKIKMFQLIKKYSAHTIADYLGPIGKIQDKTLKFEKIIDFSNTYND